MFDASTLVSATFSSHCIPAQAVQRAVREDQSAIFEPVMTELLDVLHQPGLACFLQPALRSALLGTTCWCKGSVASSSAR